MAVLYITEFSSSTMAGLTNTSTPSYPIPAPMTPPVAEQHVAIGAMSAPSAAFNAATNFVMIETDAICSLAFGASPVAVTTAHRMAANEVRFYGVVPGQAVAVIANT
jgi:hypothetical protein